MAPIGSSTPPIFAAGPRCTFLPICAHEPTKACESTSAPSSTYAPTLMYIGGTQITPGATYAPLRTEEPPATMRTASDEENRRGGNASLSTKVRGPAEDSAISP